jgi:hypothetical protein
MGWYTWLPETVGWGDYRGSALEGQRRAMECLIGGLVGEEKAE